MKKIFPLKLNIMNVLKILRKSYVAFLMTFLSACCSQQYSNENIERVVNEINYIQDKNFEKFEIPIINNSLNLNISNVSGYIIINHIKEEIINS